MKMTMHFIRTIAFKSVISNVATMRDFQMTSNKYIICRSYQNECGRAALLLFPGYSKK